MSEAATSKPAPFDVVVVHGFSRFFRDHFDLAFYARIWRSTPASSPRTGASSSPSRRRWVAAQCTS